MSVYQETKIQTILIKLFAKCKPISSFQIVANFDAMIVVSNNPTFNVKFLNQIPRGNLFLWLCITKSCREYLPNKRT